jgi:hypothetical protein
MSEWPPKDKPIKAKKKNNPGKHSIPRAPKFELKIKRFVKKVHDKNQPLIKDDKVKLPKPDKQPKDKNRYKWENNYVTEKGETIPRGKRKGPKLDSAKSWDEQGPGTSKFKMRGRGKQSDPKGYPGVKKIRAQKTNYQDPQGEKGEMNRKFKRTTKYKRSSAGYMGITKEVDGVKTRTSFPTTKQLKEHNRWAKEKGMPGLGPGIRKTKTVKDAFGSGDNYVKTYYRGKLKPKTTHYKY